MAILPKVKLKALVNFPSNILDGTGTDVEKINGAFKINLAFDDFMPPVTGLSDPANQTSLIYNAVTRVYSLIPVSILGAGGGVPEAPNDGVQYGRQSLGWSPITGGGGPAGPAGPTGPTGPTGPAGANGAAGPAGTPGEGWFTGSGNPGTIPGAINGDWYLNSANGDYWELVGSSWTLRGNLAGPQGLTGATGPPGPTGSGAGDVNGAASSTDSDIVLFSGTSGKTIKDSGVQISALQPKDATLTALAGIASTNGLIEQTGVDVFSIRGIGVSPTTSIPTTALADARYAPISVTAVPPATAAPLMDGTAAVGTVAKYAHEDHVHPTDTSRAAADAVPVGAVATPLIESGTGAVGTSGKYAREDHVHPVSGNVVGPASAVDSNLAAFDTTTGKLIKDSGVPLAAASGAVRYDVAQGLTANQQARGRSNIGVTKKNYIINGAFTIQQDTTYVSGAALAAGAYGHDQWKAGAGGGDYTFTQLKSSTTITIAAGKSLIQPIEDVRVVGGGNYVLAWTGTAQARAGVNTLTPAGAYAASPLLITGQTDGTVMSVEFNAGTLGNVGLYEGNVAPPFQVPDCAIELALCQRYYEKPQCSIYAYQGAGISVFTNCCFVPKRAIPTCSAPSFGAIVNASSLAVYDPKISSVAVGINAVATGAVSLRDIVVVANARL